MIEGNHQYNTDMGKVREVAIHFQIKALQELNACNSVPKWLLLQYSIQITLDRAS